MLKWAAQGKLDIPIIGEYKVIAMAKSFGIKTKHRQIKNIAIDLADALLADLSRTEPDEYKVITACAAPERQKVWKDMDILPISAYHEVFEAYHKTGCATDGDWESVMKQFLRCGLAFTFSGVVSTSIATDALLGVGDRVTSKVNVGALKKGYVNIAVHGHLPILVKEIVKAGQSEKFQKLAKEKGAKGIQFYGICCSGLSSMYRYEGVIPLSNAVSAELVLGTGALDLWVADVQEVYPAIMDVAKCFKTTVVTTHDSARLPGAEHIGYDHHHSNIAETKKIAERIVERAIESFEARKGVPVFIPKYEVEAEVGFSVEYLCKKYASLEPIADAIREGKILGVVNMVGCNNPKVLYEKAILDVCDVLLKNNVLIITNGCASFPLMKMGYCQTSEFAYSKAGEGLREFLKPDMPPVWHVGECIDNTRSSGIFAGIANAFGKAMYEMPFAFASPEWSNEKGIDEFSSPLLPENNFLASCWDDSYKTILRCNIVIGRIENIEFNNGDDNVAIKCGRDNDGWKTSCPSENIIIRNCKFKGLHGVVLGSEMSSGIQHVFVENCTYGGYCKRGIFIKTNPDRGGFIRDIYVNNCEFGEVEDLFYVTSMYAGEGMDNHHFTEVHDIYVKDLKCKKVNVAALVLQGTEEKPIYNVTFDNVDVDKAGIGLGFSNTKTIGVSNCNLGGYVGVSSTASAKDGIFDK